MNAIRIRYSKDTGQLKLGVAQGDSLSMLIFMIFMWAIDPIIEKLAERYGTLYFADDGLLKLKPEQEVAEAIRYAKELFATIGL